MYTSFLPRGLQHARLLCPSPTPGAFSKLMFTELVMPSNHLILCHPLLLPPSTFPSIRVFSSELALCIRWPKYSTSVSVLPMNVQDRFPLGLTRLISLQSKGLSRVFPSTAFQKHQFGEENGNPLKYSCLEKSMDRGT